MRSVCDGEGDDNGDKHGDDRGQEEEREYIVQQLPDVV
jgi:hypothetical protein